MHERKFSPPFVARGKFGLRSKAEVRKDVFWNAVGRHTTHTSFTVMFNDGLEQS